MASAVNPFYSDTFAAATPLQSPAIGTPAPSSLDDGSGDGGILASLGSGVQGISNIGLQWYTAVTKGVNTKLTVPQPVQATPGAAAANVVNQAVSYLPWIILIIALIFLLPMLLKAAGR